MRALAHGLLLALVACSDAQLYGSGTQPNFANKIALEGEICTDDPSAVSFPVKVLLVVDGTAEMVLADPTGNRAKAVLALTTRYASRNYSYGVIQYGDLARLVTPGGFTTDPTALPIAIDTLAVGTGDARRNWLDALRVAATTVEDDILGSTPGQRSRTRYVVMMVSFGAPRPSLIDTWCAGHNLMPGSMQCSNLFSASFCPTLTPAPADCEALVYPDVVTQLRDFALKNGAADLVFDTFALRPGDMREADLFASMAAAGHGAAVSQPASALNLLVADVATPSSLLLKRELLVYNANAVVTDQGPAADSDGDGISDAEEKLLGTNPILSDTDGDGVSDKIEILVGDDPKVMAAPLACALLTQPYPDTDQDGLNDCEEAVLRTDPSLPDTDRDGIPDLVEVLREGNPLVNDLLTDSNQDGVTDGDAMKEGLEVRAYNANKELDWGYRYRLVEEGPRMRLEATPTDPIAGILIASVKGSVEGVGQLHFDPGPPATLSWTDSFQSSVAGPAVDISKGGSFTLVAVSGAELNVKVFLKQLPRVVTDVQVLVRYTQRTCFQFDVHNITLVQTQHVAGGRAGEGWNTLATYLSEVPGALPSANSIVDESTVPVRFLAPDQKTPNRPFVTLQQDDFVLLGGN